MCVVWVGMVVTRVGCDVCPCDPCDRVCPVCPLCVPAPPGIFLPVPVLFCTGVSRLPRCLSLPVPVLFCTGTFTGVSRLPPVSLNRYRYCTGYVSRLPPVSLNLVPRCLFTGTGVLSVVEIWSYSTVQSRLPPVSFYRYSTEVGSGPALRMLSRPRFRLSRGRAGVSLGLDGCEVRLCDPCARVSRVCPGSPRCLFTGTVQYR